ncbi:ABC transporter ATP-binding protein [Actinosynnema mirum]|uniref:ABC transporter related n=1 Tax=Actinosynnema mirum (strain ATCC 29888 / DSM 43827 / JCM 3225 / NBRC 14064 / NCIMB 13271 / NRRL B-12336 / IMRU 3971 / 101) TaxID=446462 RepID=C6WP06_ACTMD|nr:ATP-binding cassette domain-containing protein [Actinosynnema mirum]ACU36675.1 ABC transporter related [Actinosynnema mirum DSM 43827]
MLSVNNISRSFSGKKVLDGVSFQVRPGRMTGFLGANGSGKTTTMRIILGVLEPSSGTVEWNGAPVTGDGRQKFGYMPEERGLYPKMAVGEQVEFLGRLHGMERAAARRATDELLEQLELTDRRGDALESLSLGNQQRVQIAAALVHSPDVLILDEPFSGLDPIAVETVLEVLRKRAASGVPVLFSSHQLSLVERLCDDVVIIAKGGITAQGERDELRRRHGTTRFEITVDGDAGFLRDVPGVRVSELDGPSAVFEVEGGDEQPVLRAALERGPVRAFGPVVPTLDEIFKEVV